MKIGRGYYAIACTPKGGIFMDGVVFRFDENHFWYVQADGPFEMWLLAHSEGFDVEIKDPKSRVIQIQGPASLKIIKDATNGQITEAMKYYSSGFFDFNGQELYVSRSGFTGELGYEIYCDGYKTDHLALWDHLMSVGKNYGMEFSSTRALTIRRIEGGILGNTTDMDINMSPFEAGLSFVVDLEKDDFIGRKALLNMNKNVLLHGLTCKTATPSSGSKILDGNEEVGYITAGVPSPTLGLGIGYARFLKGKEWQGKQLKLSLPNGEFHSAEIVDLPFFDKEKKIIYYKNAWLEIYDKPVIYFPKFFHPDPTVKRQSGFLVPKFESSSSLGDSLSIPYYNVISESKDFTFTPYIFENNLQMFQNEFREIKKNSKTYANLSLIHI